MPQRMRLAGRILAVTSVLLTVCFIGCNHSDSSQYHQVDKRQQKKSDAPVDSNESGVTGSTNQADEIARSKSTVAVEPNAAADSEFEKPVSALLPVNVVDGANIRRVMSATGDATTGVDATRPEKPLTVESAKTEPNAEARKIELLIKDKSFRADSKTGALRVSYDDLDLLKVLNMDPVVDNAVELMPEWLRGLNGKAVRLRGYMFPTFDAEGIEHFVLARDNQICCFGRDPKVYDLVQVNMKAGKTTNYIHWTRAFDVVGIFKIELISEDGKPFGLYTIDNAEIIER